MNVLVVHSRELSPEDDEISEGRGGSENRGITSASRPSGYNDYGTKEEADEGCSVDE